MRQHVNAYIIAQIRAFSQQIFIVLQPFRFLSLQNRKRYAILAKEY